MRALFAAALLWYGIAFSAFAQPFPQLYDVTGVAGDDVLNVRIDPSASSAIVGQLTPQQKNIEVVAGDSSGKWGLVNVSETSGWVAMRFLHAVGTDEDYALAPALACAGTEPFWSLDVVQGQSARFTPMSEEVQTFPAAKIQAGAGRPNRFSLGLGEGSVAVIVREMCDDGMSDREFGLRIDLVTDVEGQQTLLSGCCSIAAK
jgi:uncharacterized membrane protein